MVYKWKINLHSTDAQTAGEVCKQLEETVGLTAKNLLDASRPEDAPLHREFEWNDDKAAELYRESQARFIIRNLVVADYSEKSGCEPIRAYFKVSESKHYKSIETIVKIEDKRRILLQTAIKELQAFRKKYDALSELDGVFKAIEDIKEDESCSNA